MFFFKGDLVTTFSTMPLRAPAGGDYGSFFFFNGGSGFFGGGAGFLTGGYG